MNKYIITGVAGFVGYHFVEYLKQNDKTSQIIGVDIASKIDLDIQYHQLDLNNKVELEKVIKTCAPDYIVHLASISSVGQSWQDPASCFQNNTTIMLNILEAIVKNKLKTRVLSIGSSEEYGNGKMPLKEDMLLNPQNPYAVAKVSQEMLCRLYAQNMGVDIVMTRSFNHIGPRQSERFVIPSFIRQLVKISQGVENKLFVGNIDVARDFTDVRDVVDAYYKILTSGESGAIYNVCSGRGYKLREIIEETAKILNIEPQIVVDESRIRPNDITYIVGDNTKLKTQLGWEQKFTLQDTLSDIIEYWKKK